MSSSRPNFNLNKKRKKGLTRLTIFSLRHYVQGLERWSCLSAGDMFPIMGMTRIKIKLYNRDDVDLSCSDNDKNSYGYRYKNMILFDYNFLFRSKICGLVSLRQFQSNPTAIPPGNPQIR